MRMNIVADEASKARAVGEEEGEWSRSMAGFAFFVPWTYP